MSPDICSSYYPSEKESDEENDISRTTETFGNKPNLKSYKMPADRWIQSADSHLSSADSQMPSADTQMSSADTQMSSAHSQLPSADLSSPPLQNLPKTRSEITVEELQILAR